MNSINEQSLARVWQLASDYSDKAMQVALITAFRHDRVKAKPNETPAEAEDRKRENRRLNVIENRKLMADVRNLGCGFTVVTGVWKEGDEIPDKEDSLFVTAPRDKAGFKDEMVALAAKYEQHSVFVRQMFDTGRTDDAGAPIYRSDIAVWLRDGSRHQTLKHFRPATVEPAYTELRSGGNKNRSFSFVEATAEPSYATRQLIGAARIDGIAEADMPAEWRSAIERFGI